MNIYNYDGKTKEYLYTSIAKKDPEETKIQGKFIPLVPANATLIEPIFEKNKVAVFDFGNWKNVSDFRGQAQIEVETEQESVVSELGELKSGFILKDDYLKTDIYKQRTEKREKERIAMLSMTKYDFFKHVLKPAGFTYQMLQTALAQNEEMQIAWDLCERVYRGDETLGEWLKGTSITDEQLTAIFETVNSRGV